MSSGPFEHPLLSALLGDDETAGFFTADAEIAAILAFETALARVEARLGIIPEAAGMAIEQALSGFRPDIAALKAAAATDGVVIPGLVKQLRAALPREFAGHVHFGATSQDAVDTGLMLRLKPLIRRLKTRLERLDAALAALAERFGARPLTGYTRMQAAIEITVADRIAAWRGSLPDLAARLEGQAKALPVQFGGAAGTLETFSGRGAALRAALAAELGLADRPQWHSRRRVIADLGQLFALVTGTLGKFGQDVALMAELGGEIALSGGGGSSAMPHKQNPVAAEVLVALARFNAVQVSGLHHALVHEQERSGAAWTLEWLLLPQMAMAADASLQLAEKLSHSIVSLGRAPNGENANG